MANVCDIPLRFFSSSVFLLLLQYDKFFNAKKLFLLCEHQQQQQSTKNICRRTRENKQKFCVYMRDISLKNNNNNNDRSEVKICQKIFLSLFCCFSHTVRCFKTLILFPFQHTVHLHRPLSISSCLSSFSALKLPRQKKKVYMQRQKSEKFVV